MTSSDNYTIVLLEEMNRKFDQMIELMSPMCDDLKTKASIESAEEIKSDVKIIKAAVTNSSTETSKQNKRISLLEKRV